MAFFDELGAKLSKTGQKTVQKANDLADITKLNLRTNELNKVIQDLYGQLGRAYYTAYGHSADGALADICGKIAKASEEIEQIRLEIQRIKQIKVCPSCGFENSSESSFCCKCSASLPDLPAPEAPKPAGRTCPQCGAGVPESAQFCTMCGCRLQPADSQKNSGQ